MRTLELIEGVPAERLGALPTSRRRGRGREVVLLAGSGGREGRAGARGAEGHGRHGQHKPPSLNLSILENSIRCSLPLPQGPLQAVPLSLSARQAV